jgi:hypothetical protein
MPFEQNIYTNAALRIMVLKYKLDIKYFVGIGTVTLRYVRIQGISKINK